MFQSALARVVCRNARITELATLVGANLAKGSFTPVVHGGCQSARVSSAGCSPTTRPLPAGQRRRQLQHPQPLARSRLPQRRLWGLERRDKQPLLPHRPQLAPVPREGDGILGQRLIPVGQHWPRTSPERWKNTAPGVLPPPLPRQPLLATCYWLLTAVPAGVQKPAMAPLR